MKTELTGTQIAVSNSELATFKDCKRRWGLQYYLGYKIPAARENPVSASRLGTRIHAALEGKYGRGLDPVAVLRAVYDKAAEDYPGRDDELAKEYDFALAIVEGYLQWTAETGCDADLVPIQAEQVITVAFAVIDEVSVILQCRIDAVFERKSNGSVVFVDHKSTASLESKKAVLAIDDQAKTQALVQRMHQAANKDTVDFTVDEVIFNLLKKSKRTARATPPFYERVALPFSSAEMTSMWRRIHKTVTDVIQTRRALDAAFSVMPSPDPAEALRQAEARNEAQQYYAPPTPSPDCSWKCPFLNICPEMDSNSRWEDALEADYERGNAYEYLDTGLLEGLLKAGRI